MNVLQSVERKYRHADMALKKNEPEKAVRLLRELVESEPDEPLFHWRLGYALSEMKNYHHAILEFRQALKLDPKNVAAAGCLGRAYMELKKWPQAEKAIRARLDLKQSPQHYIFLAHILMERDKYDEAVECCRAAIDLDPAFPEAYLNLGLALRHLKRLTEAIDALKKAVDLDDEYAMAFRELGLTYYAAGKIDLAKNALATCLNIAPNDSWGHLYMALCLENLNHPSAAEKHFAKALKMDPTNSYFKRKYVDFKKRKIKLLDA